MRAESHDASGWGTEVDIAIAGEWSIWAHITHIHIFEMVW